MEFSVTKKIFTKFSKAKFGVLVIKGVNNKKASELIFSILDNYSSRIKSETNRLRHRKIGAWENSLKLIKIDSNKIQPSHKALLKRAITSGHIPDINPLVNAYNFISLKHLIPVGGHDMDTISSISIDLTTGNEAFVPMNSTNKEQVGKDEFAYIDKKNNNILTRHFVWRQCDGDKITDDTKNILIPIDDLPGIFTHYEIENIATELATIITKELGGKATFGVIDKYNTSVDIEKLNSIEPDEDFAKVTLAKRMDVIVDEKSIDSVLSKGIKDIFPTKDDLKQLMISGKRLKIFTGIDPTADFIHVGHIIWMKKLREFQLLGHEITFLIGGFTAMIGDPDKAYTREPLTQEQVRANFESYKKDASKILDFDMQDNPIKVVNNYDWLSQLDLEDWLGIMSNVTMQHILSHDMFRKRIDEQQPIRLHETMYPLMQGYDSVHMEVDIEAGGSDQTFNMLTGRILERNILGHEKFVIATKLLTDNTGKKMGKTTNNAISFKDLPKDVYGKVMSFSDEIMPLAYELLSKKTMEEIDEVMKRQKHTPMDIKKELAYEITTMMYNEEEATNAATSFQKIVQNKELPDDATAIFKKTKLSNENNLKVVELLTETGLVPSKQEAKRLIQQGGIKIDGKKISNDITQTITPKDGMIIQAGKRKHVKLVSSY